MKSFPHRCQGLLAAVLLALPACQRPEEPPQPAHLIPKANMVPLLAELHLLEARVENSRLANDSARALFLAEQKTLFWKYEVTDSTFRRSYRYYGIHNKDLDEIYGAVIDTLKARQYKLSAVEAAKIKAGITAPK